MAWSNRGHNTTAARLRILERDGYRCVHCGTSNGPFDVDHIDNTRGPGYNLDSNLQTLCTSCHEKKTRREIAQGQQRRAARRKLPTTPHPGIVG